MLEHFEGIAIVAVQTILRANPQETAAILKESQPGVLGQSLLDGKMLEAHDTPRAWSRLLLGWGMRRQGSLPADGLRREGKGKDK